MIWIVFVIQFVAWGAFLYRLRGASWAVRKYTPRPLPQILFVLPYAVLCPCQLAPVALLLSALAICTGHGNFQDLGDWKGPVKPEKLEFVISWLYDRVPAYWYDAAGLAVTGVAVTLFPGIALGNPILALSGALKAPAYMVAKKIGWNTAGGEWLTGALLYGALVALT